MLDHFSDISIFPDPLTNRISFSVEFSLNVDGDLGEQLESDTDKLFKMVESYLGIKRKGNAMMIPDRVVFNGPATIAFWPDGTKTVVKCAADDEDVFDRKTAIMWCFMKKIFGTTSHVNRILDDLVHEGDVYVDKRLSDLVQEGVFYTNDFDYGLA